MKKTFKLEGETLQIARDVNDVVEQTNKRMRELQSESDALRTAANKRITELIARTKALLGVDPSEYLQIDTDYLEHDVAFAEVCTVTNVDLTQVFGVVEGGEKAN